MNTNQRFRQRIIKQRKALSIDEVTQLSAQIATNLCDSKLFQQAKQIATYLSVSGEADPTPLAKLGKVFYLPVLKKNKKGGLHFVKVNENSKFTINQFGISEPILTDVDKFQVKQLDLVIMPLVGFDQQGNRIGMGGGYYDRSFSFKLSDKSSRKPLLIGYAYEFQKIEVLKPEVWDVRMDGVVTEKGLFLF